MAKSILHFNEDFCLLCGGHNPTEWHHVFGGAYRKKSEHYGLKVKLHVDCHREKPDSPHRSAETALYLHQMAQKAAMNAYDWDIQDFVEEFGTNYLDTEWERR